MCATFLFTVVDGKVYYRENSLMRAINTNMTAENRIKGMVAIRDCLRNLIEMQTKDSSDYEIQKEQEKLNSLYDNFSRKYGLINRRANSSAFCDDSSYYLLCSLEIIKEGKLERKADIFTKERFSPILLKLMQTHPPKLSVYVSAKKQRLIWTLCVSLQARQNSRYLKI